MSEITIGQKIKLYRLKGNLSQFELEQIINASAGSLCRMETGLVNPTKETLFALANALCLSKSETAYLFGIIKKEELYNMELKFVL